jgi:hypothetical protein
MKKALSHQMGEGTPGQNRVCARRFENLKFLIFTRLNIKTGNATYLSCYLIESELVIILNCWRQRHIPSTAKKENYASHIHHADTGGCPDSALGGRVPAHPLLYGGYPEELIPGSL